jgi:phospholipid/cholesterol/gamma-HCH transport system substrate-binding protein
MKRSNDFIVGLTILLAAIAIVVATIWVGQADLGHKSDRVVARLRDVGGIQLGHPVVIRGVRAGRVDGIELADGGWVQLRLALDPEVRLPPDPIVLLSASSLFGEWQATVMPRSGMPQSREVERQVAEATGVRGVLPGATLPDIAQLTAVAGRIAGDVASVAERFQLAFDDRAARELRLSIRNVADLSTELARTVRVQSRNMDGLARDVRSGVQSLNHAATALQRTVDRIDASTSTGEVKAIVENVGEAAVQLRETSLELRAMSRELTRSQGNLERFLARSDSVVVKLNSGEGTLGLLLTNPSLYQNSDSLVREVRALIADFKARPKRYIDLNIF